MKTLGKTFMNSPTLEEIERELTRMAHSGLRPWRPPSLIWPASFRSGSGRSGFSFWKSSHTASQSLGTLKPQRPGGGRDDAARPAVSRALTGRRGKRSGEPLKKAELFERYEERHARWRRWLESGQCRESLLREFEKNCRQIFQGR